jgi:hypothetical protein
MTLGRSTSTKLLAGAALALAAACGRADDARLDDALRNDLSLATQAQQYPRQGFVSPQELGAAGQPYGPQYNPYAPQPGQAGYVNGQYMVPAPAPQPQVVERVVYRDRPVSSTRRSSSSGSRSSGGSGTYGSAGTVSSEPRTTVKKNTKRDAAIGAVAGAAIGVATSGKSDRLKGGLLGAVIGATAGAVIGNNVDKKRVPY